MKLFEDLPSTNRPITAENLNQIKDKLVVVSATEPTGDNREKVWMQKGKNLFDKNNYSVFEGYINGSTLKFVSNSYGRTIYIKVQSNTTYTISREILTDTFAIGMGPNIPTVDEQVSEYKTYSTNDTVMITTGENDNYIYIYLLWTNGEETTLEAILESLQIEQGSTATEYEECIEPKIYVLNDNGVYEEFISKEDEVIDFQNRVVFNESIGAYTQFRKSGKIISITYQGENKAHTQGDILCTIPKEYAPSKILSAPSTGYGACYGSVLNSPDGVITIGQISSTTASTRIVFNMTYIID